MFKGILSSGRPASMIAAGCLVALGALSRPVSAVTLTYASNDSPSLAVFNGRLFMAYTGTDSNHRLNYAVSSDGLTFSQVTDNVNRSASGPAIAAFNGKMYAIWTGASDHRINIASSTDGQHYSGQFVINANWNTPWRPALAAGGGALYLAWLGYDNTLYVVSSTNGVNFSAVSTVPPIPPQFGQTTSSYVLYPPTMAAPDGSTAPRIVYTWSQARVNYPNYLYIRLGPVTNPGPDTCRSSPTGGGIQAGLGYLPGETLMSWASAASASLDVNGGNCVAGGSTYGPYGTTGVAPAVVGFNGHAYYAWTGTDSAQHINIIQAF